LTLEGKNCESFDVIIEETATGKICDGSSVVECFMDKAHEL
jgi:hypothetical protein